MSRCRLTCVRDPGGRYYFLPWAGAKPCVTVHCQWEDISHRLHTLNMLLMVRSAR